jgi:2-hydroxychromene-2-carboxylate isomerase
VWDRDPAHALGSGVRALLWSLVVRDHMPDAFIAFHMGLFSARHDDAADLNDPEVLAATATDAGLDPEAIAAHVAMGTPSATLAREHTGLVEDFGVFGVPTFISGGEAVFVRFMERHRREDLDRVVDMLGWSNLNEFKRTRIPR